MHEITGIGKPATRALNHLGITSLEQLVHLTEKQLLNIHGVGPKAIRLLNEQMKPLGLNFATSELYHGLPFILIGDLNCDNAPKRRTLLEYCIATALLTDDLIESTLHEGMTWTVPGEIEISGRTNFVKELRAHQQDVASMEILSIVTHGKAGAVHGIVTNVTGGKVYFGDFMTFDSNKKDAKIKKITSYVTIKE